MNRLAITSFQQTVLQNYQLRGRHDLPWRASEPDGGFDPYKILVSELMLQQTQVSRVIPKYHLFLKTFPTVRSLADAPLGDVLKVWSGLGYNRRAKYLHQAAHMIASDFDGQFPKDQKELTRLPGVGPNTAGAIMAYAFNIPVTFIETNIRSVYIHHFFANQPAVADKDILALVSVSLDTFDPRNWYWALMDYGASLKQTVGNASRASASYSRQSRFKGSKRQVRGQVILVLTLGPKSNKQLQILIPDPQLAEVLTDLLSEGMIHNTRQGYEL